MPPKRSKKNVSPEEIIAARTQHVELLQMQCAAVEKMISYSTDQGIRIEAEIQSLHRSIALTDTLTEQVSKELDDKVKFMKSFSATNIEQLRQRNANMQKSVDDITKENEALRVKIEELEQRKEEELRCLNLEADMKRSVMNEKALQFGLQLKEALAAAYANSS